MVPLSTCTPEIRSAVPGNERAESSAFLFVGLLRSGPSVELDYSKSDQFGVGLTLWSMFTEGPKVFPYQDATSGYIEPNHTSSAEVGALVRDRTNPFAQRLVVPPVGDVWSWAGNALRYKTSQQDL